MVSLVLERPTYYMRLGHTLKSYMAQPGLGMYLVRSLQMILLTPSVMTKLRFFKEDIVI